MSARALARALATASLLGFAFLAGVAFPARAGPDAPASAAPDPLAQPALLPDIVEGSPAAKITIIEYASLTCSHCAAFHAETWPSLKKRYVDAGTVKFILREFPLDPLAAAGFMLARCQGADRRDALVDLLFDQQKSWAFAPQPAAPLLAIVKQTGMSQTDFESCLRNQDLYNSINKSRDLAASQLAIVSTPTFFINGRKLTGDAPIGDFDKILTPLLQ